MQQSEKIDIESTAHGKPAKVSSAWKWAGRLFRLCLLVAIVGVSSGLSYYWMANPPTTQRRPPKPESVLVEVSPVEIGVQQVIVTGMGEVIPAREIQIAAQVSGKVIEVNRHFEPGGQFRKGDTLLKIERKDYELAVQQQTGNLTKVQSDVRLEMGQQAVAKREYEILGETADEEDEELLLRQPQLAAKEAAVSVAEATLEKARIDLERTEIIAPFNALIQTRLVDLGSYVGPGAQLAKLVGTDEFWVEVSVPVDELAWIDIPSGDTKTGAPARVYNIAAWGAEIFREGRVTRLLAEVEPQGRMARVLVTVQDPLDLNATPENRRPLLLGSFVRIEVNGKNVPEVAKIPRTALRDGARVWIMTNDNTLDIRSVEVAWSENDYVYVSAGLSPGDALVVSDLAAPVQGMSLRTGNPSGGAPESPQKTERPA